MSSSLPWLATLRRIREHRRDGALHSLAQSLQAATRIRESAASIEAKLACHAQAQQQNSQAGRIDSERLRQIRQDRDELRTHRDDLHRQQATADAAVCQAQANAADTSAQAEVLQRLQDRHESTQRQFQRRWTEQSLLEDIVALCNGPVSD